MQVVFAHYHLNPGGVTQVMLNQLRALDRLPTELRPSRVGLMYGGRAAGWPERPLGDDPAFELVAMVVPELDYDDDASVVPNQLLSVVGERLDAHGFAAGSALLHIHNHSLGKNAAWTRTVGMLAERGYRLLLQVHDFAEDFRPANYQYLRESLDIEGPNELAEQLYPQSSNIHYATLTGRDADILRVAGVSADRLHVLPNPVAEFADLPDYDDLAKPVRRQLGIADDAALVLYPVRGIRRKNLGELLLYAAISPENTWHAVTLAPKNPVELRVFERWNALAVDLQLRVLLDTSARFKLGFHDVLAASDRLITTSVAEGFGMVFLEAWLAGKPLVGRSLPEIVAEFEHVGLRFDGLRESFEVPLSWLSDRGELAAALREAYVWVCEKYGAKPDPTQEQLARQLATGERPTIDFALLPGEFQRQVIRHASGSPTDARREMESYNPGLGACAAVDERIAANAAIVRSNYSLETIGQRVCATYRSLADSDVGPLEPLPNGESILRRFLSVDRLHAIRFEE